MSARYFRDSNFARAAAPSRALTPMGQTRSPSRRRVATTAIAVFVVIACWERCAAASSPSTNVVILLADDLGFGDPGFQGGRAHTPHLDTMARSDSTLVFNRFYCGGAVCSPTRASILTGRTPNRVCIWDYIDRSTHMHLPHNEFTIAHAAAKASARSLHVGKWHLGHFATHEPKPHNGSDAEVFNLTTPAHVGFDEYYSSMPMWEVSTTFNCGCWDPSNAAGQCVEGHWEKPGGCDYFYSGNATHPDAPVPDTRPMLKDGYGADNAALITDHFVAFANASVAANKPFLAVLWFQNVHVQYTAVKEFTDLYPVGPATTAQQQDYWGSLSAMDAQVGRVRDTLRALGVARDTVVWFTSDNGPEVNQPGVTRGLIGRKRDFTEGGIRMPTLLEWPARVTQNRNVTAYPAVSTDILPTVLDIWGVAPDHPGWPLDGTSLLPLIDNPALLRRGKPIGHATSQPGDDLPPSVLRGGTPGPSPQDAPGASEQHQLAWTDNDLKLWVHWEPVDAKDGHMIYRLFNISAAWYETTDLSTRMPDTLARMENELLAWYASVLNSSSPAENNCRADQPGPPH